jgi:hypothetical protein
MKTLNQATLVCPPVRATSYHLRRHARQSRRPNEAGDPPTAPPGKIG